MSHISDWCIHHKAQSVWNSMPNIKELGLKITLPPEKLPEFKTSKKEEPKQEQKTEQPATA